MGPKKAARLKRAARTRYRIRRSGKRRLCVHRTLQHIYAQVISSDNQSVLASASTLDKELRGQLDNTRDVQAAAAVGELIAKRCNELSIKQVAFDRSGFLYHGRIKALADAAREGGLDF